jgi:hypothetical protein
MVEKCAGNQGKNTEVKNLTGLIKNSAQKSVT